MTGPRHHTVDVPVAGGDLRVGVWDAVRPDAPTIVAVHGITSSHLAWQQLADALPGVRIVAPDLRGRGQSHALAGPAGMASHADDLAAVCAAFGLEDVVTVGHSMGGFVAVVFAHRHPELVSRLVLVDGGLPLDVPGNLSADELVAAVLGPTASRLALRFADTAAYLDFWHPHPAFQGHWTPALEAYFAYDLVEDGPGGQWRPATSYETTREDTIDLHTGVALGEAVQALRAPTTFITVPRGLQNEPPGLYPADRVAALLAARPAVAHQRWDGFNHYTVVLTPQGAGELALVVVGQLQEPV